MFGSHIVPGISVVVGFGPSGYATWPLETLGYIVWLLEDLWYAVWLVAGYLGVRDAP
jgi:hypothetical protein